MNREQMIKEARTIEAMRNGYMGLEGKFSVIAKNLGQPIVHQGSLFVDQTFLDDPYKLEDPDEIPMMDEDEHSYEVGLQFDGLSSGINLTISVQYHLREIICRYEGQIVYKEISGELEGYAPNEAWESKIEGLYNVARKQERRLRPIERAKLAEAAGKKREEVLEYLRKKWGL